MLPSVRSRQGGWRCHHWRVKGALCARATMAFRRRALAGPEDPAARRLDSGTDVLERTRFEQEALLQGFDVALAGEQQAVFAGEQAGRFGRRDFVLLAQQQRRNRLQPLRRVPLRD